MPSNPYTPPAARVTDASAEVSDDILKKIKQAWIAAVISGSMTLIVTLLAMSGTQILNFTAWQLIDVAWIFGLAYGIYRRSRACAVLMFVYFVLSKIYIMSQTGQPNGIFLGIVFTYYFWQGVSGTFAYHKALKEHEAEPARA